MSSHHPHGRRATPGRCPPASPPRGQLLGSHRWLLLQGAMGPVSASIDVKTCQEFHRLLVKIHYQGLWLPSPRDITGFCDLTDWTWVPLLPGTPWDALSSPEAPLPWSERWVALGSATPSRPPGGPQEAPSRPQGGPGDSRRPAALPPSSPFLSQTFRSPGLSGLPGP